jgi:hypothetical protein
MRNRKNIAGFLSRGYKVKPGEYVYGDTVYKREMTVKEIEAYDDKYSKEAINNVINFLIINVGYPTYSAIYNALGISYNDFNRLRRVGVPIDVNSSTLIEHFKRQADMLYRAMAIGELTVYTGEDYFRYKKENGMD